MDWRIEGPAHANRAAFRNSHLLNTEDLAKATSRCGSVDELVELVKELNGFYAIVLETEGEVIIATDRIRSTPLFYRSDSSEIIVTDDDRDFDQVDKRESTVVGEYALTGYAAGSDTLLADVKQVEAGQIVSIDKEIGAVETSQHTDYHFDLVNVLKDVVGAPESVRRRG